MIESLRERAPDQDDPPVVMGVLNVTPDSFSDGGAFLEVGAAVERAARMMAEGAAIIDVGPESTRPGSNPVSADEQIRRCVPVIERIRAAHADVCISIDTSLSEVAGAALRAGADWINDVSALEGDPAMADLAAEAGATVVLMHMRGRPRTMQETPRYDDVVAEVSEYLAGRIDYAVSRGIKRERIVIDPGIGFGKTVEHNLLLLRELRQIVAIGPAVLVGASRKSFIGRVLGVEGPQGRLSGSLACAVAAILAVARIVRAHDVRETVEAVRMCHALRGA